MRGEHIRREENAEWQILDGKRRRRLDVDETAQAEIVDHGISVRGKRCQVPFPRSWPTFVLGTVGRKRYLTPFSAVHLRCSPRNFTKACRAAFSRPWTSMRPQLGNACGWASDQCDH